MEVLAYKPIGLEGLDDVLARNMKKLKMHDEDLKLMPEGNGWLIAEFGGETREEADAKAHALMERLEKIAGRAEHETVRRPGRREKNLGSARSRTRRDGARAGRTGDVGRLGRQRGAAGQSRNLSARTAKTF